MLGHIFKNPLRLCIALAVLAAMGIWCGIKLPISLYPQTSKPFVMMNMSYGGLSSKEFIRKYGSTIEFQLENIKNTGLGISEVKAEYSSTNVDYTIIYDWKVPAGLALKEVETVAGSIKGTLPKESADSVQVWQWSDGGGFLAISFYSQKHTLAQLHSILDPMLSPELRKISDAKEAILWNPEAQEVSILLIPEKLTSYGILPGEVYRSLEMAIPSLTGGEMRIGQKSANIQISSSLKSGEDIENLRLRLSDGRMVHLKDVARVQIGKSDQQVRGFKTNGKDSLILFASPKSGANVKNMAEEILAIIKKTESSFPKGIEYRVLVDPSEFIRNAISNLFKDVILAAFLAVLVLFLFIGNLTNVATSAIEIPISMVLAFIFMYFTDMNLNLISLGGLALAAGMNVDASVVVLENIFRHQGMWVRNNPGRLDFGSRFKIILEAVKEVVIPVTLSIATTLIVFIPLTMTTNLTNAILGDLAKAVIYSHGISGFVAILLVPTLRLFLMKTELKESVGILDRSLRIIETKYLSLLDRILIKKYIKLKAVLGTLLIAGLLTAFVAPQLKKEIIGTPDTDWIYISVTAPQSQTGRQMENILQEVESEGLKVGGKSVAYTFVQMQGKTRGSVMLRLHDKSEMASIVKLMQKTYKNTPERFFFVDSWNPAELPLPQMDHLKVKITGKDGEDIRKTASRVKFFIEEQGDYKRIQNIPAGLNEKVHRFVPYENQWTLLKSKDTNLTLMDIVDLTFYASGGKKPGSLLLNGELVPINLRFEDERFLSPELLSAYPLKIDNQIIPLEAMGRFETTEATTQIFRQDGREQAIIKSTLDKGEEGDWEALATRYKDLIQKNSKTLTDGKEVVIEMAPPQEELLESLEQIKTSLLISLALIFLVLWLQFQSIKQVLVIMMTIPLGLIGAMIALYVFQSTLSLNSMLGILLLNGIAVNNAILLQEVVNAMKEKGLPAKESVLEACRSRLRPILITSLTTCLGMLPIAMGLGDGGKILQPLGITVAFGLLFSTTSALIIVPILMYEIRESFSSSVIDPKEILNVMQPTSAQTEQETIQ